MLVVTAAEQQGCAVPEVELRAVPLAGVYTQCSLVSSAEHNSVSLARQYQHEPVVGTPEVLSNALHY